MTDSINNNGKKVNPEDDLDARLDNARSNDDLNDWLDDETAIDKLLISDDFDGDDALLQADKGENLDRQEDDALSDELDDLLSFDDFSNELSEHNPFSELDSTESMPPDEDQFDDLSNGDELDTTHKQASNVDRPSAGDNEEDALFDWIDGLDESDLLQGDDSDHAEPASSDTVEETNLQAQLTDDADFNGMEAASTEDASLNMNQEVIAGQGEDDELFDLIDDGLDESDLLDDEGNAVSSSRTERLDAETEQGLIDQSFDDLLDEDDFIGSEEIAKNGDEPDAPQSGEEDGLIDGLDESDLLDDGGGENVAPSSMDEVSVAPEEQGLIDQSFDDLLDEDDLIGLEEPVEEPIDSIADDREVAPGGQEDDALLDMFDGLDESDLLDDETAEGALISDETEMDESMTDQDSSGQAFDNLSDEDELDGSDELLGEDTVPAGLVNVGEEANLDDSLALVDDFSADDLIQDESNVDLSSSEGDDDVLTQSMLEDSEGLFGGDEEIQTEISDETAVDEADAFLGLVDDNNASELTQEDEIDDWTSLIDTSDDTSSETDEEPVENDQGDGDNFDSLFKDVGFDDDSSMDTFDVKDEPGADQDPAGVDDLFQLDEASDDFSNANNESGAGSLGTGDDGQEQDFLLPDFDITADSDLNDDATEKKENLDAALAAESDVLSDEQGAPPAKEKAEEPGEAEGARTVSSPSEGDFGAAGLAPAGLEFQELKQQLDEAEHKLKKTKVFSYAALGFGIVAVGLAAGLGYMTYHAHTEIAKLTEDVTALETNLAKSAANSPSEEVDAMRDSVGELNQQVNGFISELKDNPEFPNDLLDNKLPEIVAKQDMVSKALDMLQVKIGGMEQKLSSVSSAEHVEPDAAKAPEPEQHIDVHAKDEHANVEPESHHGEEPQKHEQKTDKAVAEHEVVQDKHHGVPDEHSHAKPEKATEHHVADKKTLHEPAPVKVDSSHEKVSVKDKNTHDAVPVKAKPVHDVIPAKPHKPLVTPKSKPVIREVTTEKAKPVKPKKPVIPGKWGVNIAAYQHEWFAQSKAAEFARKGIYAEVVPVPGNGRTMYRLRVGGIKTRKEALKQKARIEKTLNLDAATWVSDN